ncbi:MAG: hypothetical protein ACI87W_001797 [Halieaceae bacterium]|jgi:hypothetical protein
MLTTVLNSQQSAYLPCTAKSPGSPRRLRTSPLAVLFLSMLAALLPAVTQAQQSERFGPYELHYSVVNTTFIAAEVAAEYGIARGKRRGILNLSLREHLEDGSTVARSMTLDGRTWDLTQQQVNFDFLEVREGSALYYIGEFKFINREWRHFDVDFTPEGSSAPFTLEFKHQMYIN